MFIIKLFAKCFVNVYNILFQNGFQNALDNVSSMVDIR